MKDFDDFVKFVTQEGSGFPEDPQKPLVTVQALIDLLRLYHNWANEKDPS